MARTRFEIKDSFGQLLRDLRRCGSDAATELRKELGLAVGEIINTTPQDSGMAASGWTKAAGALHSSHKAIKDGEAYAGVRNARAGIGRTRVIRSAAMGRRMGKFKENVSFSQLKRAVKTGEAPKRIEYVATNAVRHITFLEYGKAGNATSHGKNMAVIGGFIYAMKPLHIVRDAVRRMKQRIGPAFAKALKANIRRPKKYKRTVIS